MLARHRDTRGKPMKTAIVTGGSRIGAGVVTAFLGRGYNVVASSRNITRSRAFEASDKLALIEGSIADAATAEKIAGAAKRRFGSIDALVNNAGILFMTQLAIKQMSAQKTGGSIVNIMPMHDDHRRDFLKALQPMGRI